MRDVIEMLDAKAQEAWQAQKWAGQVVAAQLSRELEYRGFSPENPASPKNVQKVIDYLHEKHGLVGAKPDESFLESLNNMPVGVDESFILWVDKPEDSYEATDVNGKVARVVCQCPTHRGHNAPVLPGQRYLVRTNEDGEMERMCHRGTDEPIVQGDFLVVDPVKGTLVRYCPVCARSAIKRVRQQGERITFYTLANAINVIEKAKEAAAEHAKAEEQAARLEFSASRKIRGQKPAARRSGRNARRFSGNSKWNPDEDQITV